MEHTKSWIWSDYYFSGSILCGYSSNLSVTNQGILEIEKLAHQMLSISDLLKVECAKDIKIIDTKVKEIILSIQ
ncbi:MAG: hypothetical protein ACMUJM_23655 [bacterium]